MMRHSLQYLFQVLGVTPVCEYMGQELMQEARAWRDVKQTKEILQLIAQLFLDTTELEHDKICHKLVNNLVLLYAKEIADDLKMFRTLRKESQHRQRDKLAELWIKAGRYANLRDNSRRLNDLHERIGPCPKSVAQERAWASRRLDDPDSSDEGDGDAESTQAAIEGGNSGSVGEVEFAQDRLGNEVLACAVSSLFDASTCDDHVESGQILAIRSSTDPHGEISRAHPFVLHATWPYFRQWWANGSNATQVRMDLDLGVLGISAHAVELIVELCYRGIAPSRITPSVAIEFMSSPVCKGASAGEPMHGLVERSREIVRNSISTDTEESIKASLIVISKMHALRLEEWREFIEPLCTTSVMHTINKIDHGRRELRDIKLGLHQDVINELSWATDGI